uniref:Uncharacterized protein n=1 Tax=Myotis myotis TaxID=51298 RepID=A0A7J7QZ99_MYOMY|nr:hypothetical protein mMyoMyo1_011263 [Myotis myotis]
MCPPLPRGPLGSPTDISSPWGPPNPWKVGVARDQQGPQAWAAGAQGKGLAPSWEVTRPGNSWRLQRPRSAPATQCHPAPQHSWALAGSGHLSPNGCPWGPRDRQGTGETVTRCSVPGRGSVGAGPACVTKVPASAL